jgi:hypothetical protein
MILTTKGFLFGFSSLAWDSSNQWKVDNARKTFIFSIRNPDNIAGKKFPLTNSTDAIYCGSSWVPTFGGGNDLYTADSCNNSTNNSTNIGGSYAKDTGIARHQFFTGEYKFRVKEIKAFQVNDQILSSHLILSRRHSRIVRCH